MAADIYLYDQFGEPVLYQNADTLEVDTPVEGEHEIYTHGVEETKSISPDFSEGNMVEQADFGKLWREITLIKPNTLLPHNVRNGITIAGIAGTLPVFTGKGDIKYVIPISAAVTYTKSTDKITVGTGTLSTLCTRYERIQLILIAPPLTGNGVRYFTLFRSGSSMTSTGRFVDTTLVSANGENGGVLDVQFYNNMNSARSDSTITVSSTFTNSSPTARAYSYGTTVAFPTTGDYSGTWYGAILVYYRNYNAPAQLSFNNTYVTGGITVVQ